MNCQTARQTLELLRPEENATAISGEAEQHVRDCIDCQGAVRAQQQLDLRVGRVCRDVGVPVGLKERLLADVAAAGNVDLNSGESSYGEEAVSQPAVTTRPAITTRRRWLVGSVIAAGVVAASTVAILLSRPAAPTFTLEDVTKQALEADAEGMSEIQAFSNGVSLKLPTTMLTGDLKQAPRRLGERDVVVYFFKIRTAAKSYEGKLIVLPKASVSDAPTATSFLGGGTQYRPPYGTTAWVEGKLVYVCCVSGGDDMLRRLQPATM